VHIDSNGVVTLVPVQHNLVKGTDPAEIIDKLLATELESGAKDCYDYRYEDAFLEDGPEPALEAVSSRGGLSAISDDDIGAITARVQAIDEASKAEKQEQDPPVTPEVRKSARFQAKDYRKQVILDAAVADGMITMIAAADGTIRPVPLIDGGVLDGGETLLDPILVDCCTMPWKRADKERPDLSDAAHIKELKNVFITHKVCHPVHYNGTDPLHRSHDLFDIKLADDSGKSRFVVGKVIGGGEAVDVGIPLYSPTMDMKLIYTMLSIGLQNKLELSVADASAAFLRSKMPVPGVLVLLQKHMVDRLLAMDELPEHWAEFRRSDGTMVVECDRAWYGQQSCCAIWNGEINQAIGGIDSRSHSGIAIFLGSAGAAVYCASGKQKKVTRSTCDSEIVPLELSTYTAAYTAAYFREVLQELGVDVSLVVHWEDNEAALHLVKNGTHEYAKKRKHIVGAIHSTKEYLEEAENLAVGMHCHTSMMTADSSTKGTHGPTFTFHTGSMKGHDRGEYYGR